MKHLFLPGKLLLIVFLLFNSPAKPQGTPFVCDDKFFISHGNANTPNIATIDGASHFSEPGSVVVVNISTRSEKMSCQVKCKLYNKGKNATIVFISIVANLF